MEYFDTHMHLDDEQFDEDREKVIKKIYDAGVTMAIDVGTAIDTSQKAIEIAKKHDFIYAMSGIHPQEIPIFESDFDKYIDSIRKMATKENKVVAIGEIGLDYHWEYNNVKMQKRTFEAQIDLANELDLPISIHTRDAIDDTIAIIRKKKVNRNGVIHCCPFNPELVRQGLELGYYIAFGGTSTFRNSKNAKDIVQMVPLEKMLIETDSPYLAPDPLRGTRNDSSNLKYIVKKIAEFKGITEEEMAKATYENAKRLFRI